MKKAIFAFLALLQISVMAFASEYTRPSEYTRQGFYAGGLGGINFLNIDSFHASAETGPGFNVGAFLGYKFCNDVNPALSFRVEGEISFRHNSLKQIKFQGKRHNLHGHINSLTYMANAFYDFDMQSAWSPYIGVGIGYMNSTMKLKLNNGTYYPTTDGFVSQYIGGVAWKIDEKVDMSCDYRYMLGHDLDEHTVALSVKRYF